MSRRLLPPPADVPVPDAEASARGRPRQSGSFGVLDIGTSKIVCAIGRVETDFSLRVLGFGWQKGRGVRGGGILDIEDAERAIRAAVGQAEEEAGVRLRTATINLSAGQPESRLYNVQLPIGGRAVTENDIRRLLHVGRDRAEVEGRSIIHTLPLAFTADDAQGVADPRGLHCQTLIGRINVIDAVTTALRTLDACLARCDLEIAELVSAPMAAGMATLVPNERLLGATVLDMGGGTTGLGVFAENQLLHTEQLPLGGAHVTNDIARVLSTTVAAAERLKTLWGSVLASPDDEKQMLQVPQLGEDEHDLVNVPRSMVVNIIRPRLEETFELVRQRLDASGMARTAGHQIVLTGGASQLGGIRELAQEMLGGNVRLGRPMPLRGLADSAQGPAFATAVGLLAWAAGEGRRLPDIDVDADRPRGWFHRLVEFLRNRL
jgi:cell division protein FtsA